jgi:hypothetical protein
MLAGAGIGLSAPILANYAHTRATYVADLSAHNKIDPVLGYRAAMLLDANSNTYRNELAERYIAAWEPQAGLETLNEPHTVLEGSREAVLRSKALMELDRGVESTGLEQAGEEGRLQQLLVKAVYSNKLASNATLIANSTQQTGLAQRVANGGLPLAQELQKAGMPQTALRLLDRLAPSVERERLIARIHLDRPNPTDEDIQRAREAADRGVALEPSSSAMHELSREVYAKQGDDAGVDHEAQLLERLYKGSL